MLENEDARVGRSEPQLQAPAADRIRAHSSPAVNKRIDRETRGAIEEAVRSPFATRARLDELDREWNIDRAVMLNFGIAGAFTALQTMRNLHRTGHVGGWGLLFATQIGFLINHAVRGWCPPMPILRRLGFRSAQEICAERCALEASLRDG
jgi:hypothetical protein